MKRHIPGLHQRAQNAADIPDGLFLVRVERAFYRYHPQKSFFTLHLTVLEPEELAGRTISGRLYCTPKALWKLGWFLRDFGYNRELLGQDLVEEKDLLGLRGVVKVSHATVNGHCLLNLDGFAPAAQWEELALSSISPKGNSREQRDDL